MSQSHYPQGKEANAQIAGRHRTGSIWRFIFQLSTIIGILVLVALAYNILTEAFGLVAIQNAREPEAIVLELEEARLLSSPNTVSSEDDNRLAEGIIDNPNSIGFFGFAHYQENSDQLKLINVNNVEINTETVENGEYPFARPLYLYTTAEILQENPAAAAYVNYYLDNVNSVIGDVGYFEASNAALTTAREALTAAAGETAVPADGTVRMAGSSTVFPLSEQINQGFTNAGFGGNLALQSVGSTGGLRAFCIDGSIDIANASRPITPGEFEACRSIGREPLEIRVGTDAIALVTGQNNDFLTNVSTDQLRDIFIKTETWAEIDGAWPSTAIERFIPGQDSGTLDFFTETVFPEPLEELPKEDLVQILAANVSSGVGRRLEREQRFFDTALVFESVDVWAEICAQDDRPDGCIATPRNQNDVYLLVLERVVEPDIIETWSLVESLTSRSQIEAEVTRDFPNAKVEFRSWINPQFVVSPQSSTPEIAGVRTAIFGTLWVVLITMVFSFPVGVGAAIYLEEYANENWLNNIIKTNINNLAGVPSIIYGMLGLAIFVRTLEVLTSGAFFGAIDDAASASGRTVLSAGLTLGLLILPLIIINAQEAIRAVPSSLRQASMGLGATQWQTIWHHVLPSALPGVLTGTILAMSRAIGETAPLIVVGASTAIFVDPNGPFSRFTVLPIQIYQWVSRPQGEFQHIAAAAIVVLLIILLSLNATAVILRNRAARR